MARAGPLGVLVGVAVVIVGIVFQVGAMSAWVYCSGNRRRCRADRRGRRDLAGSRNQAQDCRRSSDMSFGALNGGRAPSAAAAAQEDGR
jgi:hypothetical protein